MAFRGWIIGATLLAAASPALASPSGFELSELVGPYSGPSTAEGYRDQARSFRQQAETVTDPSRKAQLLNAAATYDRMYEKLSTVASRQAE